MSAVLKFHGRPVLEALTPPEVRARKSPAQLYRLREHFTVETAEHRPIVIPAGFVSDFASVPRAALWYVDDDAPEILFGALVHDYLYAQAGCLPDRVLTRQECDDILRQCMLASGARPAQAWVVYQAVRLGGGKHWGAEEKAAA